MREAIINIFDEYALVWVFLHVFFAIIWTGGMVVMRFSVMPTLALIEDEKVRISKTISIFKSFFKIVSISIVFILISAIVMIIALGFKGGDLYPIVIIKEAILVIMIIVFVYAYIQINKAQKRFVEGNIENAKKYISKVKFAILINLSLSTITVMLGITLRGF
jgi:uncharacterized membrane protein